MTEQERFEQTLDSTPKNNLVWLFPIILVILIIYDNYMRGWM